jgi:DNA-binding NarL/FixJ family response regulator
MKGHIILIEDDPQQSASIKAAIERRYQNAEVELLETEAEFYKRVEAAPSGGVRPRMIVCDVMLPWAHPDPGAPAPGPEVIEGKFRKAGLRCWVKSRESKELKSTPWVFFTVLDQSTIEFATHSDERTGYARKGPSIEPLLKEIEECLHLDDEWRESEEQVTKDLLASPRMRKILLAGLKTPLENCAIDLP